MSVEIIKKRPLSFGIKVAVSVIVVSVIIGGLLRLTSSDVQDNHDMSSKLDAHYTTQLSDGILVPVIHLPVSADSKEKQWNEALARAIKGESEVSIPNGRVDVMTKFYAIEIDFEKKWQEGLGQAIHYGDESNRIGVVAIIDNETTLSTERIELIRKVERLCLESGVKLILLRPETRK